jgi:hypothetical protein
MAPPDQTSLTCKGPSSVTLLPLIKVKQKWEILPEEIKNDAKIQQFYVVVDAYLALDRDKDKCLQLHEIQYALKKKYEEIVAKSPRKLSTEEKGLLQKQMLKDIPTILAQARGFVSDVIKSPLFTYQRPASDFKPISLAVLKTLPHLDDFRRLPSNLLEDEVKFAQFRDELARSPEKFTHISPGLKKILTQGNIQVLNAYLITKRMLETDLNGDGELSFQEAHQFLEKERKKNGLPTFLITSMPKTTEFFFDLTRNLILGIEKLAPLIQKEFK